MFTEEKELWIRFACAALTGLISSEGPEEGKDMAELADEYADAMIRKFYDKYGGC